MDFTREPVVETIITPREGFKLVVRSSKNVGQEEFFVDALELIALGSSLFYRSLERPKCFLLPACDYEILEVREARIILKKPLPDRAIKISSHREREGGYKRELSPSLEKKEPAASAEFSSSEREEDKKDRRKERRRSQRKKRLKDPSPYGLSERTGADEPQREGVESAPPVILSRILPPPENLISDTLKKYRQEELFREVFGDEISSSTEKKESVESSDKKETIDSSEKKESIEPLEKRESTESLEKKSFVEEEITSPFSFEKEDLTPLPREKEIRDRFFSEGEFFASYEEERRPDLDD